MKDLAWPPGSHRARVAWGIAGAVVWALSGSHSLAVVTHTTQHSVAYDGFDSLISNTDLIAGLAEEPPFFGDPGVYENPGDLGWHPANPAAMNGSQDPNGLPAFTDGVGEIGSGLTGLLNENFIVGGNMPLSGAPVKVVEYVLAEPSDIGRINILTGNRNNSDGRIFSTTVVNYSTDGGSNFDLLGYFQSDPSGTVNNEVTPVPPLDPANAATFVSIFNDADSTLLSGVTNIEFTFFAVDNTGGQMRDPYDGVNDFTGEDDGLGAAFVSPLVWEIDVLEPSDTLTGDYNLDGLVNAADYTMWRDTLTQSVTPGSGADGNMNGEIDVVDYAIWRAAYVGPTPAAAAPVPEPLGVLLAGVAFCALPRRRRRRA